jgi:hypothetical protein
MTADTRVRHPPAPPTWERENGLGPENSVPEPGHLAAGDSAKSRSARAGQAASDARVVEVGERTVAAPGRLQRWGRPSVIVVGESHRSEDDAAAEQACHRLVRGAHHHIGPPLPRPLRRHSRGLAGHREEDGRGSAQATEGTSARLLSPTSPYLSMTTLPPSGSASTSRSRRSSNVAAPSSFDSMRAMRSFSD